MTSPHSGRSYLNEYISTTNFSKEELRFFEDSYIDKLFDFNLDIGVKFLISKIPRVVIDLNRDKKEIDPKMFFNFDNKDTSETNKVISGIGLFPKLLGNNSIYKDKLDWLVFEKAIENVYDVWHSKLEDEINETKKLFSEMVLLECHSMPSYDLNGYNLKDKIPEFVIGDLWGESSNKDISNFISDFLKKEGFNVSKNVPYAGAYTLKQYGNFKSGVNAIQLEIRKDLYLDEKKLTLKKDFSELKLTMKNLVKNLNNLLIELNNYQKSAE